MKRLVFVENPEHVPVAARLGLLGGEGTIAASTDELVVERLGVHAIRAVWLEKYLDADAVARLERESWRSATNWFEGRAWSADFTYRGINLGGMEVLALSRALFWIYKNHFAISELLRSDRFDEIVCFRDRGCRKPPTLKPMTGELIAHAILEGLAAPASPLPAGRQAAGRDPESGLDASKIRWIDAPVRVADANTEAPLRALLKSAARLCVSLFYEGFRKPRLRRRLDPRLPNVLFCSAIQHVREILAERGGRFNALYLGEEFRAARMKALDAFGIPAWDFSLLSAAKRVAPSREARAFLARWRARKVDTAAAVAASGVISFEGKNMYPFAKGRFEYLFGTLFPRMVLWIDVFSELLRAERVSAVCVDEDALGFRRTLAAAARVSRAGSLVVCHMSVPTLTGHEVAPLEADAIAVGGPFMKEYCVRYGIPPERVIVTGIPRYDPAARMDARRARDGVCAKLGISPDAEIISFLSTSTRHPRNIGRDWKDLERGVRDGLKLAARHPEKTLVIKLHPSDQHDEGLTRAMIAELRPQRTILVRHFDTLALLCASRLVVTFFSSCVLEACLFGKPVLLLDYFKDGWILPVAPGESPCVVRDGQKLFQIGDAILNADASALARAREFNAAVVEGLLFKGGAAAQRVADELRTLARGPARAAVAAGRPEAALK